MLQFRLGCLLNIKCSCWSKKSKKNKKKRQISGSFKRRISFPIASRNLFWIFPKIKADIIIYVYQFVHPSPFSTQFSSDQIQNGGVNSDGWRRIAILACACATMCQWNLPWCEGFYCLLWRTSHVIKVPYTEYVKIYWPSSRSAVDHQVYHNAIELNFDSL